MSAREQGVTAVIGAGPAGLGAAYELARRGKSCEVFEAHGAVGGLARSVRFGGCTFDVGPHRFYTKNREVNSFWREMLGENLLRVPRLTRIYYRGVFFYYPLRPWNALRGLGFGTSARVVGSYLRGKLQFAGKRPGNFEEWMVQRFGRALYEIFFKTYTEKIWGVPCRELGTAWAAQRIKNLNLPAAIANAFFKKKNSAAKSLVEEFFYPAEGAGMLYERMRERIVSRGGKVHLDCPVRRVYREGARIAGLEAAGRERVPVTHLFSSAPITFLARVLDPAPPPEVRKAAEALRYRDHITVNLVVEGERLFPDQWIYVHDSRVRMARVANYANFSPRMAAPGRTPLSVEYFVFATSDSLWNMPDHELMHFAADELARAGLLDPRRVQGGFVLREKDSYPAYYTGYEAHFKVLKDYFDGFGNLSLIGRAGMYKYDNQDHALLTGFLAARAYCGEPSDPWAVNADDEYLETQRA